MQGSGWYCTIILLENTRSCTIDRYRSTSFTQVITGTYFYYLASALNGTGIIRMVNRKKKAPTSSASSSQSETNDNDDWVVPKKGVDWKGPFLLLGLAPILLAVWVYDKKAVSSLAQSISQRFGQDEPLLSHCPPGFDDLPLDPFINRYLSEGKGKQPPFNVTEFLKTFRHHPGYDAYQESYTERKAMTRHYKKWISSNVKPGDKIFESAAGIGLNLFMALEVIQEETGISDITIYGNEYLEKSAQRANILLGALLDDANGIMKGNHLGKICPGDSTNLTYIPPESFDLVFTGYLRYVR